MIIRRLSVLLISLQLALPSLAHDHPEHQPSSTAAAQHTLSGANQPVSQSNIKDPLLTLNVFKSETCGCCTLWLEQLEDAKIAVNAFHPKDLNAVKQQLGIVPAVQSCHTAVSEAGYFFEGHVPIAVVREFLANPPKGARGLAVPGMPIGSPGMEMGERFHPYDVVQINADGSQKVYAHIATLKESLRR